MWPLGQQRSRTLSATSCNQLGFTAPCRHLPAAYRLTTAAVWFRIRACCPGRRLQAPLDLRALWEYRLLSAFQAPFLFRLKIHLLYYLPLLAE